MDETDVNLVINLRKRIDHTAHSNANQSVLTHFVLVHN